MDFLLAAKSGARLTFCLALLLAAQGGCSTPYVMHLAQGQARILLDSRPIEEVLADPTTEEATRAKLELVQQVKRFGEEVLGLKADSSFTTFAPVEGRALLYIVTAAPKLELRAHKWDFPFVGTFPYKGFFDKSLADAEVARLSRSGLDTHMRGATAYSTLGWFTDPVYEPLLWLNDTIVANVVLHEKTHATVFVKGDLAFNEGLASFVGQQGSIEFFTSNDGSGSPRHEEALRRREDERRFGRFLKESMDELRDLYSSNLTGEQKLRGREELFEASRKRMMSERGSYNYSNLPDLYTKALINNAFLLSLELYTVDVTIYVEAFEKLDRDLAKTITFFKKVGRQGGDPKAYVIKWLDEGGPPEAARPRSML
jgi:predicted aminopeptidase